MRQNYLAIILLFVTSFTMAQNTGIGTTTPNSNAILELQNNSNPLGLLLPRQDIATFTLAAGDAGMMVYNTVDNKVYIWNGTAWVSSTSEWGVNGTDIFNLNSGNVGIGTNTPGFPLDVNGNINISTGNGLRINGQNAIRNVASSTYVGQNSGTNTTGGSNTFVGGNSGSSNTTGFSNVYFGFNSALFSVDGNSNTFVGTASGQSNTSGSNNTFIGLTAGFTNTIGNSNTLIGRGADVGSNNLTNATALGVNAVVSANNSLILGATGTSVGIGTSAPDQLLEVENSGTTEIHVDAGVHAYLNLDAGTATSFSSIFFNRAGAQRGGVRYTHSATPTAEFLSLNVNNNNIVNVEGSGEVGVGTLFPVNRLDVEGGMAVGAGYSGSIVAPSNGMIIEGNVGIGNNSPNAPLELATTIANRKVVLFDAANNDHEFYGFGINPGILRYQINNSIAHHVFYAASSSTTSNELMRITGTGNVGIGTATPNGTLQFGNDLENRKLVLFESTNNDHQYYGFGINPTIMRYQVSGDFASHVFYAAASASASNELMRVTGTGRLVLPGTTDASGTAGSGVLEIAGALRMDGNEIITNTGATLFVQNDNGGDLRVDGGTLSVDASANRVGIGTTAPQQTLDVIGDSRLSGLVGIGSNPNGTNDLFVSSGTTSSTRIESFNTSTAFFSSSTSFLQLQSGTALNGTNEWTLSSSTGGLFIAGQQVTGGMLTFRLNRSSPALNSTLAVLSDNHFGPFANAGLDLGTSSYRWNRVYYTTGILGTSDRRLKNNIQPMAYGLNEIMQLNTVSYDWKDQPEHGTQLGLIAQEVQAILPEIVEEADNPEKTLMMNHMELIPVLIKSIQELKTENDDLKSRIESLESK